MKTIQVIGHVGSDAVIKGNGDSQFITFSVAHTEKRKNDQGVDVEHTDWFNCTSDKVNLAPYIKKGDRVFVSGKPWVNLYNDNNQRVQASQNIKVYQFEFCGSAKSEG